MSTKLKINTQEFKDMVSKAVKGAANDNNIYMTQLMAIELKDNLLTLITTDVNNYLYIRKDKVSGDDFYAVVPVDKFSKFISKSTCDEIELRLELSDSKELDKLIVKGNGTYSIELPYDVDGDLVTFPDPVDEIDTKDWTETEVKLTTIQLLLTTCKASLLHTQDRANVYTGYYMYDKVVTSDSYKICGVDVKMFDEPKLISGELVNLLDVVNEEDIAVSYNDESIMFYTETVTVYGSLKEGIERYAIDAICGLLDEQFPSSCVVDKASLLQTLDRLSLFISINDRNSVRLTFTKDGLNIASKQKSGDELIPYIESLNFTDYTCCVDIGMLISQVKAYRSPSVTIFYGKDTLKFTDDPVTQIISLESEEE